MTETTWTTLRQVLVERYDELRRRLARRLGDEKARETLHETWLHLRDKNGPGAASTISSIGCTSNRLIRRVSWRSRLIARLSALRSR
jgi:hypothetical protein